MNVLRYEFRFKKVKSISVVQSVERIYILRPLFVGTEKWHDCYMDIQKTYDVELSCCMFNSKKAFELACVAYCMTKFNMYDILEEAFIRRDISSKNKYDIKEVLAKAKRWGLIHLMQLP